MGEYTAAKAGLWIFNDRYNKYNNQRGLIRVNNKYVDLLKASLALVDDIENHRVIITSKGVSGTLKKADVFIAS